MLPLFGFWLLFCGLTAFVQGVCMPAIRRTPPGKEADRQAAALHLVGTIVYLLPTLLPVEVPGVTVEIGSYPALSLLLAFLARVLVFDPVLNLTAGDYPFAVGQTAFTDKLLRKVAGARAPLVSAGLRVVALAGVVWLSINR